MKYFSVFGRFENEDNEFLTFCETDGAVDRDSAASLFAKTLVDHAREYLDIEENGNDMIYICLIIETEGQVPTVLSDEQFLGSPAFQVEDFL